MARVEPETIAAKVEALMVCSACSTKQASMILTSSGSGSIPVMKHAEKIRGIAEIGSRAHRVIADAQLLPHRHQRRHARKDTNGLAMHILVTFVARAANLYRHIIRIKHSQAGNCGLQHFHRVPGNRQGLHDVVDVVFYPPVYAQLPVEALQLVRVRETSVQQQVGGFLVTAVLGQVDNPVTPVGEDALLTIQVGDT